MAFYFAYDGNTYFDAGVPTDHLRRTSYRSELRAAFNGTPSIEYTVQGRAGDARARINITSNGEYDLLYAGNVGRVTIPIDLGFFDNLPHDFVMVRNGDLHELFVDGVSQGTATSSNTATEDPQFLGRPRITEPYDLYFYRAFDSDTGGSLIFDYEGKSEDDSELLNSVGTNAVVQGNANWVFYDDGQGGVQDTFPATIPTEEVVEQPNVARLLETVETEVIPTEEVVNSPLVEVGVVLLSPDFIPSAEVVGEPEVVTFGVLLSPNEIPTEEVVNSPTIDAGVVLVTPQAIPSEEVVQDPEVRLLLSQVLPEEIATEEQFGSPVFLGGDRIAIPVNDRVTWNRVAKFLRTRKFKGNDNDVILAWLRSEGYMDTFNDAFNTYLERVQALEGSLTDKYATWRNE